jgi:hypothetical protein
MCAGCEFEGVGKLVAWAAGTYAGYGEGELTGVCAGVGYAFCACVDGGVGEWLYALL